MPPMSKLLHSINRVVALSRIVSFRMRIPSSTNRTTHWSERKRERNSRRAEDFAELSDTGTPISALPPSVYTSTDIIAPKDGNLIYSHAGK